MEFGNEQSFKAEDEINEKRAREASPAISEKTSSRSKRGTTKGKKRSRKTEDEKENENKLDSEVEEAPEASKGIFEDTLSRSSSGIRYGVLRYRSSREDRGYDKYDRLEDPTEHNDKINESAVDLSLIMDRGYDVHDRLEDPTEPTHEINESGLKLFATFRSRKIDPDFYKHWHPKDSTESVDEENVGPGVKQKRRNILPTISACFGGFGREREEKKSRTGMGKPGDRE